MTWLAENGFEPEIHEHPATPTVESAKQYWAELDGVQHSKNLFLRNHKGNRHYLLIADCDRPLDLRRLAAVIGDTRLSFGSEERLMKYLGVRPGSVSLFSLLNDETGAVTLLLDAKLLEAPKLSFHPNDNTASLVITQADLRRFLSLRNIPYRPIPFPAVSTENQLSW